MRAFRIPSQVAERELVGVSRRAEPRYNCRPMGRTPRRFWLDVAGYQLLCDGRAVRLERQPMELLILLASRSGALVTRQEIAARFWGSDVFVDVERSINRIVAKLRVALQDDPDRPRFIETIVGKGYRLITPLDAPIRSVAVLPFVSRW